MITDRPYAVTQPNLSEVCSCL